MACTGLSNAAQHDKLQFLHHPCPAREYMVHPTHALQIGQRKLRCLRCGAGADLVRQLRARCRPRERDRDLEDEEAELELKGPPLELDWRGVTGRPQAAADFQAPAAETLARRLEAAFDDPEADPVSEGNVELG